MQHRGKILVVDDNVELAENLAEILGTVGYEAEVAVSAEAASAALVAGGCDAVITDFKLPGRSGAELIATLREAGNRVPVVVISAYTDPTMVDSAEAAGAVDVLPKPVDIGRLLGLLEALRGDADEILIVDDDQNLVENLAEALRGEGLRAVIGLSAGEALAHRRPLAAALIDYTLPDKDGVHVAERLSARFPAARILMFSAHCDEARRAEVQRRLPNIECLEKPVDMRLLLAWANQPAGG
jgi:DNA-binding NtrC family response regulator